MVSGSCSALILSYSVVSVRWHGGPDTCIKQHANDVTFTRASPPQPNPHHLTASPPHHLTTQPEED